MPAGSVSARPCVRLSPVLPRVALHGSQPGSNALADKASIDFGLLGNLGEEQSIRTAKVLNVYMGTCWCMDFEEEGVTFPHSPESCAFPMQYYRRHIRTQRAVF